jgi:hypothetical protein
VLLGNQGTALARARNVDRKLPPLDLGSAPAPAPAVAEPQPPAQEAAAPAVGNVEKCINCQYYDRRHAKPLDGKAPLWGQCRRHAPHLNPVTAKAYVIEGVWPLVRDDDWCGEYEILTRVEEDWIPESAPTVTGEAAAESHSHPADAVAASADSD